MHLLPMLAAPSLHIWTRAPSVDELLVAFAVVALTSVAAAGFSSHQHRKKAIIVE
jgi:hypothetical protein